MKPGICFRSRKFESHIIFIGQSYFFKTNNTNQFSHIGFGDVGELIGTTTIEKAGLLSPDLFKVYPHFVNAYDSVYKIADNVTDWYRAPIAVLCNDSADTCMDFLSFIYIPDTGLAASLKRILKKPLQVKYYIKGRDLFVSFTFNNELPNHAYILSPYGVQLVGTPDIIDDSFTEITETL